VIRPDLSALAFRLGRPPVTRFAPSPTGYLHLGHVVNAIYVWGVARALGGTVLLRIEDHDRIRSRPQFEAAILDDLDWLGFTADEGCAPQRGRAAAYESALAEVRTHYPVYACGCSRKEIGGEWYPGTCRTRGLAEADGRGLRVQIDAGAETFVDALAGSQVQHPADESGDLLIRDRDGHWTYQFAVTVDDQRDGVTLVIRGTDLLSSTGRQLRLARMLGRIEPPVFLHHALLYDAAGRKLSKSDGAAGVRELRAAGQGAADVIGRAAAAVGLLHAARPVPASAVAELLTGTAQV
jgi:glutamyl-tRNA synthetase/glutamyl-Q tRNA(Asp) synthetase